MTEDKWLDGIIDSVDMMGANSGDSEGREPGVLQSMRHKEMDRA